MTQRLNLGCVLVVMKESQPKRAPEPESAFFFYSISELILKENEKGNLILKKKKKKGKNFTPTLVVICQKSSFNMQFERIRMNKGNAIGFYSISHIEVLRGKY